MVLCKGWQLHAEKNNSDSTFLSKHNTFTLEAEWQTILNIKILNIIIKGAFSNSLALESLFFTPPYIDMNYHDISEYYANYKKKYYKYSICLIKCTPHYGAP